MATFQKATEKDIETVRDIAHQVWPIAYATILSPAQMEYMLEKMYSFGALQEHLQHNEILLAMEGNCPIGFASFGPHQDNRSVYHLHKIYILPASQKNKTGKKLIETIIEHIKKQGAIELHLNVNRYNPAKKFYEKLGFSVLKTEDIDIGNGYFMNDFVMGKIL